MIYVYFLDAFAAAVFYFGCCVSALSRSDSHLTLSNAPLRLYGLLAITHDICTIIERTTVFSKNNMHYPQRARTCCGRPDKNIINRTTPLTPPLSWKPTQRSTSTKKRAALNHDGRKSRECLQLMALLAFRLPQAPAGYTPPPPPPLSTHWLLHPRPRSCRQCLVIWNPRCSK